MSKKWIPALLLAAVLLLGGCTLFEKAPEELTIKNAQMNTILVCDDGSIESLLMEEFGEDYSVDELKAYVEAAANEYNAEFGEGKITVKDVELSEEGKAVVILHYADTKAFSDFNSMQLEVTVGNKLTTTPNEVRSAKKDEITEAKLVLTDAYTCAALGPVGEGENAYRVFVSHKIAYYAGGVKDNTYTVTGDGTETVYAFYKVKKK